MDFLSKYWQKEKKNQETTNNKNVYVSDKFDSKKRDFFRQICAGSAVGIASFGASLLGLHAIKEESKISPQRNRDLFEDDFVNNKESVPYPPTESYSLKNIGISAIIGGLFQIVFFQFLEGRKKIKLLQQSQEQAKKIFDFIPDATFIVSADSDTKGDIIEVNESACKKLGYSKEELTRLNLRDIDLENNPEKNSDFVQNIQRNGFATIETTHRTKDGEHLQVEVSVQIMELMGRNFFLGSARDIEERKKMEEELLMYKYFFEASGQGMGMATPTGTIMSINETLQKMLGEDSRDSVIGKTFFPYYSKEMQKKLETEVFPQVFKDGQWQGELEITSIEGKTIQTLENFFLIRDFIGNPFCLADIITNNTERKNLEAFLRQEKKKAESANEAKTTFLSMMSHEIRTPLNPILGMTELGLGLSKKCATPVLFEKNQPKFEKFLNIIHSSGKSLLRIIDMILDINKIDAGKMQVNQELFNLNTCLVPQ